MNDEFLTHLIAALDPHVTCLKDVTAVNEKK